MEPPNDPKFEPVIFKYTAPVKGLFEREKIKNWGKAVLMDEEASPLRAMEAWINAVLWYPVNGDVLETIEESDIQRAWGDVEPPILIELQDSNFPNEYPVSEIWTFPVVVIEEFNEMLKICDENWEINEEEWTNNPGNEILMTTDDAAWWESLHERELPLVQIVLSVFVRSNEMQADCLELAKEMPKILKTWLPDDGVVCKILLSYDIR